MTEPLERRVMLSAPIFYQASDHFNQRVEDPLAGAGYAAWQASPTAADLPLNAYLHDPRTRTTTPLTTYPVSGSSNSGPMAVGDGLVTWRINPTSSFQLTNIYVHDAETNTTTQVTDYTGGNGRVTDPVTANRRVAWFAHPSSGFSVPNAFLYDARTGNTTQLSDYPTSGNWLMGPVRIGEALVAWRGNPSSALQLTNIFVHDIAAGTTEQVTSYTGGNGQVTDPVIGNGVVAWRAHPTSATQVPNIYVYDAVTDMVKQVTTYSGGNGRVTEPVVWDRYVAWAAHPTSALAHPNIFVYDVNTGTTTQATDFTGGGNWRMSPLSMDDGYIAWYDNPTSGLSVPNVYVYDIATDTQTRITDYASGSWRMYEPRTSDGFVAWQAHPTSGLLQPNLFVHEIATSTTTQVTQFTGGNWLQRQLDFDDQVITWRGNPTSANADMTQVYVALVDTTAPTADVQEVTPDPRATPVESIEIHFDEPVFGLDASDLRLTRDGGPNLLGGGQTLTTSDGETFSLGNLTALTGAEGSYTLSLNAAGSGVTDRFGNALASNAADTWTVDTTAPRVTSAAFSTGPPQEISLEFSEDVGPTLSVEDLQLENLSSGTTVPAESLSLSYDAGTRVATITFPGYTDGILPEAQYRARIPAADLHDPAGNPLAADFALEFSFHRGDANGDGTVNLTDFNILAANFGQADRTFSQGDFNYDGVVNLQDFNILAARFGTSLGLDGDLTRVAGPVLPTLPRTERFGTVPIITGADADDEEATEVLA